MIGSRLGAIAELVRAIGEDWLVPPGDTAALAARMRRAIEEGREQRDKLDADIDRTHQREVGRGR